MQEDHDTVVIGAGQAGLAMSKVLRQRAVEHVVLERGQIGERWRTERWDSLRFQFPNWSLQLPGYAYAGDNPDGFAHWSEIASLIESYAATNPTPVRERTEVTSLAAGDSGFVITVPDGTILARRVVVATGPFQRPLIPHCSRHIEQSILQTDPTRYRRPEELPDGAVFIVGSGASGCQIADEPLHAGRAVHLSVSRHRRVPRRFRGKDVYWWLERMGRFEQRIDSFPGRQRPPGIVVTGVSGGYDVNVRRLAADGVRVIGRILDASDRRLIVGGNANEVLDEADAAFDGFMSSAREFASAHPDLDLADDESGESETTPSHVTELESLDLSREKVATIIWATGYEYDYGSLHAPVLDANGRPLQQRGVSPMQGLYFLGLHWMHTIRSGLLSGVGRDAEYLAERMDLEAG